jgi:hypothetical protein
MPNIARVLKPWKEAASLSAQINLYGFWDGTTFLTKSGDLGVVLRVGFLPNELWAGGDNVEEQVVSRTDPVPEETFIAMEAMAQELKSRYIDPRMLTLGHSSSTSSDQHRPGADLQLRDSRQ